jgi:serine/threonine protein kinase
MKTKLSQVGWFIQTKDGKAAKPRYEVMKPIGSGGMANVYLGFDHHKEIEVAIKLPHKELYSDDRSDNNEVVKRFELEMLVTLSIDHPDIIRGLDMGYDVSTEEIFYVMELFRGVDVSKRIKDLNKARAGRPIVGSLFPIKHIRFIVDRLLSALESVHSLGLVHRDIKPQNILMCDQDNGEIRIKLSDFGIVKALNACQMDFVNQGSQLTQVRSVVGTPGYLSPEQATSDPDVDRRSDLYAVGALVYELVTGQESVTFEKSWQAFVFELLQPLAEEKYPSNLVQDMNPTLEQWILRMLEREPNDRYQTAAEARQAFLEIFESSDGESRSGSGIRFTAQTSLPAKAMTRDKKSSQTPLLVVLPGLIIGAATVYLLRSPTNGTTTGAVQETSSQSDSETSQATTTSVETKSAAVRIKLEDLPDKDRASYGAAVRFLNIREFKKTRCPPNVKIALWSLVDRQPRFADPYFRIAECYDREKKPDDAAKYRVLFKSVSGGLEEPQ